MAAGNKNISKPNRKYTNFPTDFLRNKKGDAVFFVGSVLWGAAPPNIFRRGVGDLLPPPPRSVLPPPVLLPMGLLNTFVT